MPNKKISELSPRTPSLTDLMIVGDPASGYSYKATLSVLTTFVGNNLQFADLGGISLSSPTNGQVLTFNGTNWTNQTLSVPVQSVFGRTGAVVAAEGDYSLTQLSDVTLSSPTSNQVLQYNGSGWVNGTISVPVTSVFGRTGNVVATEGDYTLTQLGDVTITTPTSGQVLKYNGTAWVNGSDTDTGIVSLNGLTATTQTFATGTSGTDFAIVSTTSTHTFNLPTASASNRGALSSADWSTFNAKQSAITLTTTGSNGAATFVSNTLNIPTYTLAGLGGISLSSLSASAPLSYNSGTGAFSIAQASGSTNGFLSSTDWNTFNNKQGTITLTTTGSSGAATFISNTLNIPTYTLSGLGGVSGSGTTNYVSKWTSSSALGNSLIWDSGTKDIALGAASTLSIGSNVPTLNLVGLTDAFTGGIYFRSSANAVKGFVYGTSSLFTIGSETSVPLTFQTGSIERARLTSAGRLLIGTTTESTYALDLVGTFRSTLDANINGLTVGKGGGSVSDNTAFGVNALAATATGGGNSAFGDGALNKITSGIRNVGVGSNAGSSITSQNDNTFVGNNSGAALVGTQNTSLGAWALRFASTGDNNTSVGAIAGRNQTTASSNSLFGAAAGYELTTGGGNTIIGTSTGRGITTGGNNTIIGANVTGLSSSLSNTIILADGQGNQRLYINSSGSVGIGTTSPAYTLDVVGDIRSSTGTYLTNSTLGIANGFLYNGLGAITFGVNTSGNALIVNDIDGAKFAFGTGGYGTTFYKHRSTDNKYYPTFVIKGSGTGSYGTGFDFYVGTSISMNLSSNGNLLIGTTTDAGQKLQINGTIGLSSGSGAIYFNPGANTFAIYKSGTDMYFNGGTGWSTFGGNTLVFTNGANTTEYARITTSGSMGIGTNSPNASALLDLTSTSKGFAPPRGTNAQMLAITSPVAGLIFYDTTNNKLNYYNGTAWTAL